MKKNKNLRYVLRRLLLIFIVLLLGFRNRLDGWLWYPRKGTGSMGNLVSSKVAGIDEQIYRKLDWETSLFLKK